MTKSKMFTRRNLLIGGGALVVVGGGAAFAARDYVMRVSEVGDLLTPQEAHQLAIAGDILLIDIRRPDEWTKTGVGEGANPIDMRRDDFVAALNGLTGGRTSAPVALICARGVRSRRMTEMLKAAGYSRIIDVPEGMLGSRAGPGWLKRALPTVPYSNS